MLSLHLTLPLLPGKTEAWMRFCQELSGVRRAEYEASRRRLGIMRESFALVETSLGTAVLVTIEAKDIGQALTGLASSGSQFDHWFTQKWREMHGFWLANAPGERNMEENLPPPRFMWQAEKGGDVKKSQTL